MTISMERDEESILLVIADEGMGIRPEDQSRIFARSFTGTNGRSELSATGFGLYLSKKLADKLGHGLALESERGVGTRALLRFPFLSDWYEPARERPITER